MTQPDAKYRDYCPLAGTASRLPARSILAPDLALSKLATWFVFPSILIAATVLKNRVNLTRVHVELQKRVT